MRILLDVTRTLLHRRNATPTGIDRVEHAFISRLLTHPAYDDVHFLAMTPYVTGALSREAMSGLLDEINARWRAEQAGGGTPIFDDVRALLESPIPVGQRAVARFGGGSKIPSPVWSYLDLFHKSVANRRHFNRLLADARPIKTVYLHASHLLLEHSRLFRWTAAHNIRAAFLIHDLIPIDYPEFCGAKTVINHHRRMATVSAFGAAIIANSQYTADRLEHYFAENRLRKPPIIVSPLGAELPDAEGGQPRPPLGQTPYFLHVGTIEGRKNIPHLFNVWRQMLSRDGPARTPRLVIAGRRGWKCQNVLDVLDHTRELAGHIVEISNLKDAELAALMKGACAVLAPSLVEGYSLPPVEALCHNVPVIASDIPAHREVLGGKAILLDPTDGPGWREAALSLANDKELRQGYVDRSRAFARISWQDHVDQALGAFIATIGDHP